MVPLLVPVPHQKDLFAAVKTVLGGRERERKKNRAEWQAYQHNIAWQVQNTKSFKTGVMCSSYKNETPQPAGPQVTVAVTYVHPNVAC